MECYCLVNCETANIENARKYHFCMDTQGAKTKENIEVL